MQVDCQPLLSIHYFSIILKLDQLIAKEMGISVREARFAILDDLPQVDGEPTKDYSLSVTRFHRIIHGGRIVQPGQPRLHLMLHKPIGILSATSDPTHRTVVDLIDLPAKETLHLAGRLDRSSSGLILLTNDGNWSESLTDPEKKVSKHYLVETDRPIPKSAVAAFREGFRFEAEGITTLPAKLEILDDCQASVTLLEGRYHQIKRMFHRLDGIRLVSLHRDRIGSIQLPADLKPGEWRSLHHDEIDFERVQ